MASFVPGDQTTGLSRASGGIRQFARSALVRPANPAAPPRAAASLSQPNASAEPTANPTASQATTAAADTPANSVVTTSVPESSSNSPMITPATIFSQRT